MKVKVHRNLNKGCWSVRAGNKVIMHALSLTLADCTFHVSLAGRKRVLAQKRKNVHAYVQGTLIEPCGGGKRVTYNPYRAGTFLAGDKPVSKAKAVHFDEHGRAFALRAA